MGAEHLYKRGEYQKMQVKFVMYPVLLGAVLFRGINSAGVFSPGLFGH